MDLIWAFEIQQSWNVVTVDWPTFKQAITLNETSQISPTTGEKCRESQYTRWRRNYSQYYYMQTNDLRTNWYFYVPWQNVSPIKCTTLSSIILRTLKIGFKHVNHVKKFHYLYLYAYISLPEKLSLTRAFHLDHKSLLRIVPCDITLPCMPNVYNQWFTHNKYLRKLFIFTVFAYLSMQDLHKIKNVSKLTKCQIGIKHRRPTSNGGHARLVHTVMYMYAGSLT